MATLTRCGMSRRYGIFRVCMMFAGRVLLGFTVHGAERVPGSGPVVVVSNHWRLLDPVFVCMAVPRRVQWMAKKELFVKPFEGLIEFIGAFPVDRQGGGRGALRTAIGYLREGWALGIFPEGTRRKKHERGGHDGEVGGGGETGAKSGAAMLAVRSGSPVVPVFIDRIPSIAGRLRGERFNAYVGEPIYLDSTARGRAAYREASDLMMRGIYAQPGSRDVRAGGEG